MSVLPTIHHGTLPLLLSGPVRSRGERGSLDSATWEILTRAGLEEEDAAALGFTYDQQIESATLHSMWLQSLDDEPESDLTTRVSIRAIGLIKEGEKRRRKLAVAGREISVGPFEKVIVAWNTDEQGRDPLNPSATIIQVERRTPKLKTEDGPEGPEHAGEVENEIIAVGGDTAERWNIKQAFLVVRDSYYTTTRPSSSAIGQPLTPPTPPEPPSNQFETYDKPMRANWPNGWVLDDRQVDELFVSASDPDTGLWAVEDVFGYYFILIPD